MHQGETLPDPRSHEFTCEKPFDLWLWVVVDAGLGGVLEDDRLEMGFEEEYRPEQEEAMRRRRDLGDLGFAVGAASQRFCAMEMVEEEGIWCRGGVTRGEAGGAHRRREAMGQSTEARQQREAEQREGVRGGAELVRVR